MTEYDRRLAQAALHSGNNKEARRILRSLVHQAPDDWTLWWQLAQATDEVEQKITCLKQVAKLNPSHADATKLLRQIERKTARPTPVSGIRKPFHDIEQGDMPDVASAAREVNKSHRHKSAKFYFTKVAVGVIAVGILTVIVGGSYFAFTDIKNSAQTTNLPSRSLSLQVDGCIIDNGEMAIITFKNLSGEEITLSKGDLESEDELFVLEAGSESSIDVIPDEPIRYAASVNEGATDSGGATIAVPAGSSCVVIVR